MKGKKKRAKAKARRARERENRRLKRGLPKFIVMTKAMCRAALEVERGLTRMRQEIYEAFAIPERFFTEGVGVHVDRRTR